MKTTITFRRFGSHPNAAEAKLALSQFFRDAPLFTKVTLTPEVMIACLESLFVSGFKFDAWCVGCSKETTYTIPPMLNSTERGMLELRSSQVAGPVTYDIENHDVRLRWLQFACARSEFHDAAFVCELRPSKYRAKTTNIGMEKIKQQETAEYTLTKIGQRPSPADFAQAEIRKYSAILEKRYFVEFNRAIGLASHNVGIGSFIYLRRIFERLVNEPLSKIEDPQQCDAIAAMRMDDKIAALAAHLPAFLVEHKSLYKILSAGVHELEEDECLAAFGTVRLGIEMILDERLEARAKQKKIDAASRSINALHSSLARKDDAE